MPTRIGNIAIDCAQVGPMAEFWSRVLDYEKKYLEDTYALLKDPERKGIGVFIQKVPEPKSGKNRLHIDLLARDEEAEARRVEELGATRLRKVEPGDVAEHDEDCWIVLADPEGNEFCIVRSGSS